MNYTQNASEAFTDEADSNDTSQTGHLRQIVFLGPPH